MLGVMVSLAWLWIDGMIVLITLYQESTSQGFHVQCMLIYLPSPWFLFFGSSRGVHVAPTLFYLQFGNLPLPSESATEIIVLQWWNFTKHFSIYSIFNCQVHCIYMYMYVHGGDWFGIVTSLVMGCLPCFPNSPAPYGWVRPDVARGARG